MRFAAIAAFAIILIAAATPQRDGTGQAAGTLAPSGPPSVSPVRVPAGAACVVDLEQPYWFTGALTGSATIDYRIFVAGSCGEPAGTFEEHWIAHGTFEGVVGADSVRAGFSYLAKVATGGDVDGVIVVADGVDLELRVTGNLHEDRLTYEARAR